MRFGALVLFGLLSLSSYCAYAKECREEDMKGVWAVPII